MKLNGCLVCRDDEAAEPTQREMYSSLLKQHLPHRANRYAAFELHDARSKVSSPPYPHRFDLVIWQNTGIKCSDMLPNQALEIRAAGVHYKLAGKADELIAPRGYRNEPIKGGVMGVEVKKQLAWRTIKQVQAKFLLYGSKSSFTFCMVSLFAG